MKKDLAETETSSSGWTKWRPLMILCGLGLVLMVLPSFLAQTPLLPWAIGQATANINAEVSVGSASLGWFSPVVLKDVRVVDPNGGQIAEVPSLRVSKSLLGLIIDSSDLGTIEINQPTLHVTATQGTTNLEQIFPPAKTDEPGKSGGESTPKSYRLLLRDGTVELADGTNSRTWKLEDVSVDVDIRDPSQPAVCSFSADLRDREQIGVIQGKGTLPTAPGEARFSAATKGMPLGVFEILATRLGQPVSAQGELNGQIDLVSTANGAAMLCNLEADGIHLRQIDAARGPGWNNGTLRINGEIASAGNQLVANQFTMTTDWGQVLANGNIPTLAANTAAPNSSINTLLGDRPWELRGTIDIARLAGAFPELLQIREDVQLQEGRVSINLANQLDAGKPAVIGSAVVSNIVASVQGRRADWNQPLEVAFAASMPTNELQLDSFSCRSSFLSAEGKTNGPETEIRYTLNGDALTSDLSRFVNLQGNRFAGNLEGSLQIQNLGSGRFGLAAFANGTNVQWLQGARPVLSEPTLASQIQSTVLLDGGSLKQIEAAFATLKTNTTTLSAQTSTPVLLTAETIWPVKLQLQGPIDPIWSQVRQWTGLQDFQLGGNGLVLAKLSLGESLWQLEGLNVDVDGFSIKGPLTQIFEEKLKVEGGGSLDWKTGLVLAPQFTIVGTTMSARGTDISIPLKSGGTATGQLAYRVDLSRGAQWLLPTEWLGQSRLAGEMAGTMSLSGSEQGFVVQNDGQIANWEMISPGPTMQAAAGGPVQPAAANRQQVTWREANLAFSQSISLNRQEDSLAVHRCDLKSAGLSLSMVGGIGQLSTVGNVSLQGEAKYDWNKLTPLIVALAGPQISIEGQHASQFQCSGPLWPPGNSEGPKVTLSPAWQGLGQVAWTQANLYGIPAGETTLQAQLQQGALQLVANSPELSGGKLSLQTRLLFNATPIQWQVAQGRAIDNVAITPQMCQSWLRYVAPVVADATRVDGRFSLDINSGRFPLIDPMQGEADGVLTIHSAQVTSGPLAHSYVMLARNIEALVNGKAATDINQGAATLLTLPPQQVTYRMVNGRVYHQNLIMQSGSVRAMTSGWVDANQQMQLVASIPIEESWIAKAHWLGSMRGTAINVPISGSMKQPKIDTGVIEQLTKGVIDNAARGAIEQGINRGLQELFKGR
ncbi:hypothetical protein GC197_14295 [bacterium]|nr:hypothetical protein [bacterium]